MLLLPELNDSLKGASSCAKLIQSVSLASMILSDKEYQRI